MTSLPRANGRRSGSSASSNSTALIPALTRPTARRPPSLAAPQLSVADAGSIDDELSAALYRADLHGAAGEGGDKTPLAPHAPTHVSYASNDDALDEADADADTRTLTETGRDEEEEEEEVEGSESDDDLSTTSGRRHGALLQPEMEDWLILESPYMTNWNHKRHQSGGNPRPRRASDAPDWRMRERLRTVTAALVMCLNIGVDPPDAVKTNPCSKLLCWMDPSSLEVSKALPAIGKNLQAQFETLSMKTRYKQYLDPIVEETKRFCTSLRRTAKDERVLFYYNGFGVPKPTPGGEIWVFNKAYTQYIPVTLFDLQAWLGSPCIFVWDASAAGNVVVNFKRIAEKRAEEERASAAAAAGTAPPPPKPAAADNGPQQSFPLRESIHLAACAPDETLPMNPDLPADLFTCCLTSPIEISLRWFVLQNPLPSPLNVDMVMNIPGRLQDRRTPLGELNWIFTAITDTIAWTLLPRALFRRLFRDDLMVAALLRNFLLAERIMRFYHCTPMSHPKLPPTHNHPLWASWDLAVDQCLAQLPTLLEKEKAQQEAAEGGPPVPPHLAAFEYRHSTFFSEQLKAFEVWLAQGGVSRQGRRRRVNAGGSTTASLIARGPSSPAATSPPSLDDEEASLQRDPPEQLPIVLQVLLSQVHRLRALILLSQFLDLGPWAVNLALSIGIFPYVLKLLQSPAADLKPVLIYIWARILAVDRSCQNDLLRDSGFAYFSSVLSTSSSVPAGGVNGAGIGVSNALPTPNVSEHRAMCAFILGVFCQDFAPGQTAALETDALESCLTYLEDEDFLLRQWSALCLAQLWDDSALGKARALQKDAQGKLCCMLADVAPEVRAAVLFALGTLLGASASSYDPLDPLSSAANGASNGKHAAAARARCLGTGTATGLEASAQRKLEVGIATTMLVCKGDCSPMVRKELVIALSPLVREYQGFFVLAAFLHYEREERRMARRKNNTRQARASTASSTTTGYSDSADDEQDEAVLRRIMEQLPADSTLRAADLDNLPAFSTIFVALLDLSADAYPEVASLAATVLDYIVALMRESGVGRASEGATLRFGAGAADATHRLVTPMPTTLAPDGYFSYKPRMSDEPGSGTTTPGGAFAAAQHNAANGYGSLRSPVGRPSTRRTASLAQTVKAIATLGYSRPSSPTGSPDEADGVRSPGGAAGQWGSPSGAASPLLAGRVPAPSFNLVQYVSPYAQPRRVQTPTTPDAPRSPALGMLTQSASSATLSSLAHRSSSAESLAHIARLQARRGQSGSITPGGSVSSPLASREGSSTAPQTPGASTPATSTASLPQDEPKVIAALAALIAGDLQRFRDREAIGAELGAQGPAGVASSSNAGFSRGSSASNSAASSPGGAANGLREVLPLKSRLFAWCSEYYTEPQMKTAEAEEPGSVKYNVQTWKRQRNERIVSEAQAQTEYAGKTPWTENVGTIRNGAPPYLMLMHQFEPHLITASEQDTISVWDWERQRLLSRFRNGNPEKTNVTSAAFINEEVDALLLLASAEGDVRIYSDYERAATLDGDGPRLVSTFRALPDLVRSKRPSGLIVDWQQVTGHLLAAGDSSVVRVWDAHRELCVCDIPARPPSRAASNVTSLSSEYDVGHMFIAGFGDGAIGVFDRRLPPEQSLVRFWEEHNTWVQHVHLQRRGNRELVSASTDGEVRLWDIRGKSSISQANITGALNGKLSCIAVHERAQVFAASSLPRQTRSGLSPHHTILSHLDSLSPMPHSSPLVRNFAPSSNIGSSSASAPLSSGGTARSPSSFTPSFGALTFHPHMHMLAYAAPDAAGTIGMVRAPPPPKGNGSAAQPQGAGIGAGSTTMSSFGSFSAIDELAIPSTPSISDRPRSLFGF